MTLQNLNPAKAPSVALLSTWLGDDGRLIKMAAGAGYGALIVQALGGGHVNAAVADAMGAAAAHMPVVFTSRTGSGETLRKTYGFVGSEQDLIARGAIPAGSLEGVKARLLFELLLSRTGQSTAAAVSDFERFAAAE
jgi:L-asparaginase